MIIALFCHDVLSLTVQRLINAMCYVKLVLSNKISDFQREVFYESF